MGRGSFRFFAIAGFVIRFQTSPPSIMYLVRCFGFVVFVFWEALGNGFSFGFRTLFGRSSQKGKGGCGYGDMFLVSVRLPLCESKRLGPSLLL